MFIMNFWIGNFLIVGWKEGDPFPGPPFLQHGARSELNSVFGLEKMDRWNPNIHHTVQILLYAISGLFQP
jgi:hypothetical protein